jgi:hypothetical protein
MASIIKYVSSSFLFLCAARAPSSDVHCLVWLAERLLSCKPSSLRTFYCGYILLHEGISNSIFLKAADICLGVTSSDIYKILLSLLIRYYVYLVLIVSQSRGGPAAFTILWTLWTPCLSAEGWRGLILTASRDCLYQATQPNEDPGGKSITIRKSSKYAQLYLNIRHWLYI